MSSLSELFRWKKIEQPRLPSLQEARQNIEKAFEDPDFGSLRLQAFADHVNYWNASDIYNSTRHPSDRKKLLQTEEAINEHRIQDTNYDIAEGYMRHLLIPYGWKFVDEDKIAGGRGIRARYLSSLSDIVQKRNR